MQFRKQIRREVETNVDQAENSQRIKEAVCIVAKNLGLIHEVRPIIDELRIKKFRVSDWIVLETLKRAGE
ncbi:MAG: DUF3368 domain-containing protein [Desulfobacterales bacterium]|nr:DUF3368 domain-containing protein [Desulfobacterales bacterium]